jgi:hypothetical protein
VSQTDNAPPGANRRFVGIKVAEDSVNRGVPSRRKHGFESRRERQGSPKKPLKSPNILYNQALEPAEVG